MSSWINFFSSTFSWPVNLRFIKVRNSTNCRLKLSVSKTDSAVRNENFVLKIEVLHLKKTQKSYAKGALKIKISRPEGYRLCISSSPSQSLNENERIGIKIILHWFIRLILQNRTSLDPRKARVFVNFLRVRGEPCSFAQICHLQIGKSFWYSPIRILLRTQLSRAPGWYLTLFLLSWKTSRFVLRAILRINTGLQLRLLACRLSG